MPQSLSRIWRRAASMAARVHLDRWWPFGVLVVLLVIWMSPIIDLIGGWWLSHTVRNDLLRALAVVEAWREGLWDARWFSGFDHGYGYPFLSYYAPLFHWLSGLWLLVLPLPTVAVRLNLFAWLVLGTAGMYLAGDRVWGFLSNGRAAAFRPGLICAIGWLMAPYPMCNVFVRGTLPEFASSQTVPWIVWAAFGILLRSGGWTRRDTRELLLLVLIVSAGILAHNSFGLCVFATAVVIAPFLLLLRLIGPRGSHELRSVVVRYGLWALAMGAILLGTLFYWLPILRELEYVAIEKMRTFHLYSDHYLYPSNYLNVDYWDFGNSLPGPGDTMAFHLGFVSVLALASAFAAFAVLAARYYDMLARARASLSASPLAASVAVVVSKSRRSRRLLFGTVLLLSATAIGVLMTSPLSGFLWDRVPLLHFVQFPWRLLSLPSVGIALLLPAALVAIHPSRKPAAMAATAVVLAVCFAVSHHCYARIQRTIALGKDLDPRNWEQSAIRTADIDEYGPIWRAPDRAPQWPRGTLLVEEPLEVRDLDFRGTSLRASINNGSDRPQSAVFTCNYFPGWQGRIEPGGNFVTLSPEPTNGLIRIEGIPAGESNLHIWFGDTPIRRTSKIISGTVWLLWIGAWIVLAATGISRRTGSSARQT